MVIRVDIDSDFIVIRFGYDLDLRVLENPDHLLGNEDGSPDPNTLFNLGIGEDGRSPEGSGDDGRPLTLTSSMGLIGEDGRSPRFF